MGDTFRLAKEGMLSILHDIQRKVQATSGVTFERWQEVTREAAHWSIATGAEVPLFSVDDVSIDVIYPSRADDPEKPLPRGWDRQHYWVVRNVPITSRHRQWMHAVLAFRITPIFETIDRYDWHTRAASPEVLQAAADATGYAGLVRRAKARPRKLPSSAVKILLALAGRRSRSAGRPQRHDLLAETNLKESTFDHAMRVILKPQGLVRACGYCYEITPLGLACPELR